MQPIYIASDHAGHRLKNRLVRYFHNELKLPIEDLGAHEYDENDDLEDYIIPAAEKTVSENGLAILICGSGNGACMAANKVAGIRAALGYNIEAAELARKHNDANALCLAGRVLSDDHATAIVKKFLESAFSTDPKYARRNHKISSYETGSK